MIKKNKRKRMQIMRNMERGRKFFDKEAGHEESKKEYYEKEQEEEEGKKYNNKRNNIIIIRIKTIQE